MIRKTVVIATPSTCLLVMLLGLGTGSLAAQDATPSGDEAQRSESMVLEEVTVTAQRRAESLQEVPISVSALSGETMSEIRATTLESLQGYVPNLQVHSFANVSHGSAYNIRGMGVVEPDPNAGTTVVIVEDDVPQFFNMISFLDTFDIDRVEVLRGPQGTLFGANATGGVIQVLNKAPAHENSMKAEIGIGNYNLVDVNAAMNFSLVEDRLAARVTAMHQGRDGFVTNIVNGDDMGGRDRSAVRLQLLFEPSDTFEARLIASYARHRDGVQDTISGSLPGEITYVPPGTVFPSDDFDGGSVYPMYQQPCLPNQRCKAPDKYLSANSHVDGISDMDTHAATLHMTWDVPIGQVISITGYKDFDLHDVNDQDYTPAFLDDTERLTTGEQFSQEVRMDMDFSDAISATFGAFYAEYSYDHFQDFRVGWVPGFRQLTEYGGSTKNYAVYGQMYFELSDRLRLQAGIRHTWEKQDFATEVYNFIDTRGTWAPHQGLVNNRTPSPYEIFLGSVPVTDDESWENWGGKLGVQYDVNDTSMLYGYYARAVKSGGFVGRIVIPQDAGPFNEEFVDTWEVGLKMEFLDSSLRLNMAAFYNDYKDMQLANIYFTEDEFGNIVNGNTIVNAASAKTKGIEIDMLWALTDSLRLNAAIGTLDATYKEFIFGADQLDLSGDDLQNAPKLTANAGLEYLGRINDFEIRSNAQYRYVAKKYNGTIVNTIRSEIQPTHFVDLYLTIKPIQSNWTLGFWAKNIMDNRYLSNSFVAAGVVGLIDYQDPRTYGVTLSMDF